MYLACVGPGRRGHHFLPALAPLGLLCLYPLYLVVRSRGLLRSLAGRASHVLLLVVWVYVLAAAESGSLHDVIRYWNKKPHWYSSSYVETPGYELQAQEIQRRCAPDERIYVWGWSPGTYRYAYRRCVSRFATLEKLGQVGRGAEMILQGAIRDIRRDPPKLFIISAPDLERMQAEPDNEFSAWLTAHYHDLGIIGGMHILERTARGD